LLLETPTETEALEIAQCGATFLFDQHGLIALAGARTAVRLNADEIFFYTPVQVQSGDI
jgi:allophanate hydrolase subunit 2